MQNKITLSKYHYVVLFLGTLLLIAMIFFINEQVQMQEVPSTPEKALVQLLLAMEKQDLERVRSLTTDEGLEDLQYGEDQDEQFRRWQFVANRWLEHQEEWLRWEEIDENTVRAWCCGQNESAFVFIQEDGVWKMDKLIRGR